MLKESAAKAVTRRMGADDFRFPWYRDVFQAVQRVVEAGKPVDVVTLVDELGDARLDDLIALADFLPSAANIDHYIEQALTYARERRITDKMRRIAISDDEQLPQLEAMVKEERDAVKPVGDGLESLRSVADHLDRLAEKRRANFITTGFASFDTYNGGFPLGSLSIIGARPRVGKTAIALNVMVHAIRTGNKTALYSLEMPREQIYERMDAQVARVPYGSIHNQETTPEQDAAISTAMIDLASTGLLNVYEDIRSASAIYDETMRIRPRVIFIDYAQRVRPDAYHDNRHRELEQIVAKLKTLAIDANCHVCLLSQLSRAGNDKPSLEALKESGSLEEGGDIVWLLHREASGDGKTLGNHGRIIIAKNKYGEEGEIPLDWNGQYQQFKEA
jgi:replicative DNA helicase